MLGATAGHLVTRTAEDLLDNAELPLSNVMQSHVVQRLGIGKVQLKPEMAPVVVCARGQSLDVLTLAKGEVCVDVVLGLLHDDANIPLQSNSSVY